jgi:hypothetical protein
MPLDGREAQVGCGVAPGSASDFDSESVCALQCRPSGEPMAASNGLTRTATKESPTVKGEPMRTSTWVLIVCCSSLLVACGADLPAAEAAPEPHLATTSAALVTVTKIVSNGAAVDVGWADELGQG